MKKKHSVPFFLSLCFISLILSYSYKYLEHSATEKEGSILAHIVTQKEGSFSEHGVTEKEGSIVEYVVKQKEGSFTERSVTEKEGSILERSVTEKSDTEKEGSTDRVQENNVTDKGGPFARAIKDLSSLQIPVQH